MNKEKFVVSKEEFEKFISEYPNKLEIDYFMDWYSYNDFSLNGGCVWPESMVAMKSICKNNYPQFCLQMYKVGENLSKEERDSIWYCLRNIMFEVCSVWIGVEEAE